MNHHVHFWRYVVRQRNAAGQLVDVYECDCGLRRYDLVLAQRDDSRN